MSQTKDIDILSFPDNSVHQNLSSPATVVLAHAGFADETPAEDFAPYAKERETNSDHKAANYAVALEFETLT